MAAPVARGRDRVASILDQGMHIMFGMRFMKVGPTTHVIQYKRGEVVRDGAGISFFYFAPTSTLAMVPIGSCDVQFVFTEATGDFQDVTIQGELTYRIQDAKRIAALLNFEVTAAGQYVSDDPEKLNERLVHAGQVSARSFTRARTLRQVLESPDELLAAVRSGVRESDTVEMLGVEVLSLAIVSVSATPDMAKALQADARELLLRQADEAVYARRNAAVEMERQIKENELNTEIAVEQKQRQVRETKMDADIAVEQKQRQVRETRMQADIAVEEQRAALVERRVANERKEASARGDALRATLEPMKDIDWRTLMAMSGGGDPRAMIAMAFRDLADGAERIGHLNITPDLLSTLMEDGGARSRPTPRAASAGAAKPAPAPPAQPRGRQRPERG